MYGAIIGDIAGSIFEGTNGPNTLDFDLFTSQNCFTDDTVMTIAVAEAINNTSKIDEITFKTNLIDSMKYWGKQFPNAGYGSSFRAWLFSNISEPYNSYGNGSAMRVSPVGWKYNTLDITRLVAKWSAEVTHNHPEGIKGAEAIASVIYLARNKVSKPIIQNYIENNFNYNLDIPISDIVNNKKFDCSCQGTVPQAIIAFLNGNSFEDIIKLAISFGGDTDTIAAMAGSMAEAAYKIPARDIRICKKFLRRDMIKVLNNFTIQKLRGVIFYEKHRKN